MLENYWYIALRASRLGTKPRQITMFAKPVVLCRLNGKPAAMEDRCAHRNVLLSQGKVCNQHLTCPYHGWEYDAQGNVAHIPTLGCAPETPIHVPGYHCVEQDGYIWVCTGTPVTPTPERLPHLHESGWLSIHERAFFDAPVAQVLENFLDIPHAIYVHSYWFREPLKKKVTALVRTLPDGAEAVVTDEPRDKGVLWRLIGNSKDVSMRHSDRYIAPATSCINYEYSDGRHYNVSSYCTPVSDTQTQVHTIITFRAGQWGWLIRLLLIPLARLLIWQDVKITRQQQATIERFEGKPRFSVTKADLLFPHIQRWRQALKSGNLPPEAGKETPVEIML